MIIIQIFYGILFLSILVFIHELGHFVAARLGGIAVDEFSIGFGKELIGFTYKNTRYRIGLILFGGYCKLRGESRIDREKEETQKDPAAMYNRPPLVRLTTVIAGPLFNLLFAIIILTILYKTGYIEEYIPSIVYVQDKNIDFKETPAKQSGLLSGDHIIEINNKAVNTYSDILRETALDTGNSLTIKYIRSNITNTTTLIPVYDKNTGMGFTGLYPVYLPIIGEIVKNSPAEKNNLNKGDVIKYINGIEIKYFNDIQNIIKDKAGIEVEIIIERNNNLITNYIVPEKFDGRGFLGISPLKILTDKRRVYADTLTKAVDMALENVKNNLIDTVKGLKALFSGKIDAKKNMSGPVRIVQITGEIAAKTDLPTIINMLAMISVALAFFNLLPIPGLDGSHALFSLIEIISGRKIPENILIYIESIGISLLILLSIFIFFNDLINIFSGF